MLMSGLISWSMTFLSYADVVEPSSRQPIVVHDARTHHRREHRREEPDDEGDREPLHRTGAELEQDDAGEERRDVGVENRRQRPLVAGLDRRPDRLPEPQLLTD